MLRVLALIFALVAGGIGYEEITGDDIGVKRNIAVFGATVGGWFKGVSSPAFGGFGGGLGG